MHVQSVWPLTALLTVALIVGYSPLAVAASSTYTSVSSSMSSVSGSGSTAEATISGQNGQIVVNGDRIEVKDGKLTWNGVPYGEVDERAVVKYTVNGGEKRLFVDGVERKAR